MTYGRFSIEEKDIPKDEFQYESFIESILGENDYLNISDSLRVISSDYTHLSDEELLEVEKEIREMLADIFTYKPLVRKFHEKLIALQEYCDKLAEEGRVSYASNLVAFENNVKEVEFHLLRIADTSFIKAYRIFDKEDK